MKLLFASNNRGKYDELVDGFKEVGINLVFDGKLKLIEDSPTLELNAISKAQSAALSERVWTLSDDTGFFIPALDYFPGVHANRWMNGSWEDKRKAVLEMMKDKTDRRAYLLNKFAVCDSQGKVILVTEVKNWYEIGYEDHINEDHPTFGYNPILKMQGYHIGDLTRNQRNFIKNRSRIAQEVKEAITNEYKHQEEQRLQQSNEF
jgi:non-canonical purine NTP pyrophosphatase (RdgB/HAM1 family)